MFVYCVRNLEECKYDEQFLKIIIKLLFSFKLHCMRWQHSIVINKHVDGFSGTELLHPFGLAVFEDKIYWSDWDTLSIHVADKLTGYNRTVLR